MKARLLGLLSLITVAALLVGVPSLLLTVGFDPAAHDITSWRHLLDRLTIADDGSLIGLLLTLIAWAGWAYLTSCLILEAVARIRRMPVPQIRGMRLGQTAARSLIAGVALLFVASPFATIAAHAQPAGPSPAHVAPFEQTNPTDSTKEPRTTKTVKDIKVKTGDSLSRLAERHLGDADRWPEIFAASSSVEQPGGHRLVDPDEISAGWTLKIPTTKIDRHVKDIKVKTGDSLSRLAERHLGDADRWPEIFAASSSVEQPGGHRLVDPDEISGGWTLKIPTTKIDLQPTEPAQTETETDQQQMTAAPASTHANPTPTTPGVQEALQASSDSDPFPSWAPAVGVGAVLAAGVIGVVAWRRRIQLRSWRPGTHVPLPEGLVAISEQQLRAAADPLSLDIINRALRALSRDLAATGQHLPDVRAGRLTPDQFELYLATPAAALPPPWAGTTDGTVWILDAATTGAIPPLDTLTDIPAPYPTLVTIGHDEEGGIVFLDLEYIGSLGLAGETDLTRQVLAALAVELAVSTWADDLTITVVGDFSDLEGSIASGRVRYLPTIERLLDNLEDRATGDRAELDALNLDSPTHARTAHLAPDSWIPEVLLLACHLTDRQHARLASLVTDTPRVAIAAVLAGQNPKLGEWNLSVTDQATATLDPLGMAITPQLLPVDQYSHLLTLISTATHDVPEPTPERIPATNGHSRTISATITQTFIGLPTEEELTAHDPQQPSTHTDIRPEPLPANGTENPGDLTVHGRDHEEPHGTPDAGPYLRVLGSVEVEGTNGMVEPTKAARLLEYFAYLLLHPGSAVAAIDDAIWPARKTEDNTTTRNTATSKLRRWLGKDADDKPFLPTNRYTCTDQVSSDWATWNQLLPTGAAPATTNQLKQALNLVRGRPFAGAHPRRYAWAEPLRQRMINEIVEASYELAHRRFLAADWPGVETALVTGLAIEPALEHLWRLRIQAAHYSGNTTTYEEAKARLFAITEQLGLDLEPETNTLLAALEK